jgi:hypothetical protein
LRSVARIALPHTNGSLSDVIVDSLRKSSPPTRIFERLPPALWPTLAPTAVADRLSLGVRKAIDPHRLFNRGILGETHTGTPSCPGVARFRAQSLTHRSLAPFPASRRVSTADSACRRARPT